MFAEHYGFTCDVCGTSIGSCEDHDYVKYIMKNVCFKCAKAIKDATEQQKYLKSLKK